jgi:hypothetical protein
VTIKTNIAGYAAYKAQIGFQLGAPKKLKNDLFVFHRSVVRRLKQIFSYA